MDCVRFRVPPFGPFRCATIMLLLLLLLLLLLVLLVLVALGRKALEHWVVVKGSNLLCRGAVHNHKVGTVREQAYVRQHL